MNMWGMGKTRYREKGDATYTKDDRVQSLGWPLFPLGEERSARYRRSEGRTRDYEAITCSKF